MVGEAAPIERVEGDVMLVNSYVVHGPGGVVVVDGMLTLSDARKVKGVVDAATVPLAGVIVTHAHPDHYAGVAQLLDGTDVPVVATEAVNTVIRRDDALKNEVVGPMMGDEWPSRRMFPNQTVSGGAVVELGGVEFAVRDLGPGESYADSLWAAGDTSVFAGDVAYNQMHAFLADGRYEDWLATLSRLESDLAAGTTLYVGHGEPGGLELLATQREYIETFIAAVEEHRDSDEATRRAAVVARMHELVPNERLQFLMELSIPPVLAGLRDDASSPG